jgi:Zn-dependent metalloprotease
MLCIHCSTEHNPFHCLVPPYITDELLKSTNAKVRAAAGRNLAIASEFRARRDVYRLAQKMGISESPVMTKHRLVYDAQGGSTLPGILARSEGGAQSKDKAVNQAYSYSGDVYDFYSKLFKRNSLDGDGMVLVSSVHVGEASAPMSNAFWDGAQMAYGDGDGIIFTGFTNALEVVGHELTHGVQSFTSNLVYHGLFRRVWCACSSVEEKAISEQGKLVNRRHHHSEIGKTSRFT